MGTTQVPAVDMTKLDTFIGQFVTDLGAAFPYWLAVFDYEHDMGDPIGAAAHVRQSLAEDGTWMIVEPVANHQLKDNLNPVAGCTIPSRRPCGRRVRGPRKADCALARRLASADSRCYFRGWVSPLSPGNGDTVQYRLRSSTLI